MESIGHDPAASDVGSQLAHIAGQSWPLVCRRYSLITEGSEKFRCSRH